jgi:hypothetical protein
VCFSLSYSRPSFFHETSSFKFFRSISMCLTKFFCFLVFTSLCSPLSLINKLRKKREKRFSMCSKAGSFYKKKTKKSLLVCFTVVYPFVLCTSARCFSVFLLLPEKKGAKLKQNRFLIMPLSLKLLLLYFSTDGK